MTASMKIYAISDQHGHLPTIPECDLLIVAGDNCFDNFSGRSAYKNPQLQLDWFEKVWMPWRLAQPAKHCLVTWGNHDFGGQYLNEAMQRADTRVVGVGMDISGALDSAHTRIVVDGLVEVGGLKIWLSPWSHTFMNWAFMKEEEELAEHYQAIPEGLDILVTHDTPYGYGDSVLDFSTGKLIHVGGKALRDAIDRVQPKVVICGHLHSAYGRYEHGIMRQKFNGGDSALFQVATTVIYNVSVVNEAYALVNQPTEIPATDYSLDFSL